MIYLVSNQMRLKLSNDFNTATISDVYNYFKDKEEIAFDSETEGFDPHTKNFISIQLGDQDNQFVIDCTTIDVLKFKDLLESGKTIIFHNAQFDLKFLMKHNIDVKSIYDTFLAECILTTGYETRGLGLKDVVKKYCDATLNKEIRGIINKVGLTKEVIEYAAKDVEYLHTIKKLQLREVSTLGLNAVLDLENKVVRVFAKMSYDGIKLDTNKWTTVYKTAEMNVDGLIKKLDNIVLSEPKLNKFVPSAFQQNLFGEEERKININWSSSAQKVKVLEALGLDMDNGVGARELYRIKDKHDIIPVLIKYAEDSKIASAFGREFLKFVNVKTGRIHMSIWQVLNTGRISVSDPNLNQIPANHELAPLMRSAFIPKEGYKIVGGDYSNFELRIIAEFSKDPIWINAFKNDEDLHSKLCSMTFDIPLDKVNDKFPEKPTLTYRKVQKTIDFGLAYGMSEFKLADTMGVPVETAKKVINKFFSIVPDVSKFLKRLANIGTTNGYIRTSPPFRRIRWFPEWQILKDNPEDPNKFKWLGSIERRAKNTPIQGSNGDVIKLALVNVQDVIDKNKYDVKILLSVYDEIQTECPAEFAETWKNILENEMIKAAQTILKEVPVKADCKITDYWTK